MVRPRPAGGPYDTWLIAGTPIDERYPCRCRTDGGCTSRCPCAGRTDAADMPTRCCARRQHDTAQRQAKED